MKLGVCGGPDRVAAAADNGLDYIEASFNAIGAVSDEYFRALADECERYRFPCETANCFLPGDIKVTGDGLDHSAVPDFMERGFSRAASLGIKLVVFGSGGSRRVPDGFPYAAAVRQIISFCRDHVCPAAEKYGINVAFEPLCTRETNIINTIGEGCAIAAAADRPNLFCIADNYHMTVEGDTHADILSKKGMVVHGHVSRPYPLEAYPDINRYFPTDPGEYDYLGFLRALDAAGAERCSIEAGTADYEKDVAVAARLLIQTREMM